MATLQSEVAKIKRWLSESRRNGVNIVVVGETGAGKSTLINGLVGEDVMPTGYAADSVTESVRKYKVGRGNVHIFDTPGFFARNSPMTTNQIVEQIATETRGKIDLLVYCHNMQLRITEQTKQGIGYIADTLRSHTLSWENVLYVLTQANQVESSMTEKLGKQRNPPDQKQPAMEPSIVGSPVKESFEKYYKVLRQAILEDTETVAREKQQSSAAEAKRIPVVAAGFRKAAIPGCDDWITTLWAAAYSRIDPAAAPAFMEATAFHRAQPEEVGPDQTERLPFERFLRNVPSGEDEFCKMIGQHPIIVSSAALGEVVGGVAGGVLGSAAGVPGAVAGVFGGAYVGAAVGGLFGISAELIRLITYKLWQAWMKKEKND